MPQDRYTRDKLKTLKKIYDSYNLPCRIADLRKYEQWYIDNKEELPWKDRWHNMLLFTHSILNPNIHWKDIYNKETNTWNNYISKSVPLKESNNKPKAQEPPKCHTLEIDNNSVKIEKKKSFFQRLLLKMICN